MATKEVKSEAVEQSFGKNYIKKNPREEEKTEQEKEEEEGKGTWHGVRD